MSITITRAQLEDLLTTAAIVGTALPENRRGTRGDVGSWVAWRMRKELDALEAAGSTRGDLARDLLIGDLLVNPPGLPSGEYPIVHACIGTRTVWVKVEVGGTDAVVFYNDDDPVVRGARGSAEALAAVVGIHPGLASTAAAPWRVQ